MSDKDKKQQSHQKKMEKLKDNVDASIAAADIERGVFILLTGNGKGKSTIFCEISQNSRDPNLKSP